MKVINEDDFLNYHEKIMKRLNVVLNHKYLTISGVLRFMNLYKEGMMKLFKEGCENE